MGCKLQSPTKIYCKFYRIYSHMVKVAGAEIADEIISIVCVEMFAIGKLAEVLEMVDDQASPLEACW